MNACSRSHMDKEYIEFFECEQMMNDDLVEEYKKVGVSFQI